MEALPLRVHSGLSTRKGSPALRTKGESGMEWRDRKVAVLGLGVSNIPLIRYLVRVPESLFATGRNLWSWSLAWPRLPAFPSRISSGEGYLDDLADFDAVFLSPGVPKDLPQLRSLRERGELGLAAKWRFSLSCVRRP